MSPNKAREKTIRRLSQKSFEESIKIGERNTAICRERFNQMTDKQNQAQVRLEKIQETHSNVTTPSRKGKDENRSREQAGTRHKKHKQKNLMPKLVKKNSKVEADSIVDDDEDKYYDEGGFTPRLRPHSLNEVYKSKLPSIPTGNSAFITTQGSEGDS